VEFAQRLDSSGGGRVAIQAHSGKAAAATVFEFLSNEDGELPTLVDDDGLQRFTCLWELAPFLDPGSIDYQFDSTNDALIIRSAAMVDNWPLGIKVVMGDFPKAGIEVSHRWPRSARVLGGDVLAIPRGARHPERAVKLIEQLVAKKTQLALAKSMFWGPVRQDVYDDLSRQGGRKEFFQVGWEALWTTDMRPITPHWILAEEVFSQFLRKMLEQRVPGLKQNSSPRQGQSDGPSATAAEQKKTEIEEQFRQLVEQLNAIPREYLACRVVREKPPGAEGCQVPVPKEISLKDLAPVLGSHFGFNIDPVHLAKVNGRRELEPVSPKNMQILLVPKPGN
jgi:hypothetical protein